MYRLLPVVESNVEVIRKFDPKECYVTIKMFPARTERNHWGPICDDEYWNEDNGYFLKVSLSF